MPRSLIAFLFLLLSGSFLHAATWQSHGPMGGPVRVLAAAPSDARVLYFTSGAQLFRTEDEGLTWTALSAPFTTITTFAIDPHDAQTVLVASTFGSLYRTRDGGATWAAAGAGAPHSTDIHALVFDPRDGRVVYLASDCGVIFAKPGSPAANDWPTAGIFKSVDGGLTFSPSMNGLEGFQRCASRVSVDPLHPDTLYAIPQYTDNGYARSDDGGASWTKAATVLPSSSVADPRDAQRRYGSAGTLLTSADGGVTWVPQTQTVLETGAELRYGTASAITIDDRSGRLFLAGQYGVFRSGDGGRTVLALNGAARESTLSLAYDDATGILIIGTENGLYRSEGYPWNDWTALPTGDNALHMRDVAASRLDPSTMYAISTRQLYVTHDEGLTWSNLGGALPMAGNTAPGLAFLAVDVADNVYVLGSAGSGGSRLYKLPADTQRWVELTPPVSYYDGLRADPGTAGVVYLIRPNTPALTATRDGGVTWNYHFTPTRDATSLAIDPRDGAVFYAGTRSSLFKSFDGGHTWIDVLPDHSILDVRIAPSDPDTVVAIELQLGMQRSTRIHVSHDGGTSWTASDTPAEVTTMALDPRDARTIVGAAVNGTVYRTRDDGAHWQSITGNLPPDSRRIAFSRDGSVLHATSFANGMWEMVGTTRRRAVTPRR